MNIVYCIDTSAWIEMKERYPFGIFPSLWNKLNALIEGNRLISTQQVYEELKKKDDEIFQWVKQRKKMFKELDQEQVILAQDIITKFPQLIDPQKETPDADPFVIALALVKKRDLTLLGDQCIVTTEEKLGSRNKPKIPDVCGHYALKHFSSLEFFNNEGWRF